MNKTRALSAAALALAVAAWLSCGSNRAPDVPALPTGPASCFKDTTYTFKTVVSDPDGDSMVVRFDWGDSAASHWVGWFAGGDTVASTHAWSDTGNYEVRVSAQDRERTSDLSDGLKVRVAIRWPPETPAAPSGPSVGGRDSSYTFLAGADHPDNIPVAIRFAWGDDDTSDWSEFDLPGGPVSMSHAWSVPDTYAVSAQAKDTGELTSLWSSPHTIVIRPPDTLRLWRVRLAVGGDITSSPAIGSDGTIYVGSPNNGLYAVNPNGTVRWRYTTGGEVQSSPAVAADGTVYVGSNDGCLYAVAPDGTLRWKYVTGGVVQSSPAVAADGTVYFGSTDDCFYALYPSGMLKWRYSVAGAGTSSPAVAADGTVYLGTEASSIYALNPDGTSKWRYVSGSGTVFASPAIGSDGTIYCGGREMWWGEGTLCALNPDGSLRWLFQAGGAIGASPAIAVDGTIYFGTSGSNWWGGYSRLWALNADGTPKWFSAPNGPAGNSAPAVSSFGTIYFGELGLHAVYPDGTSKFLYRPTDYYGYASSPTIGSDGTVYFTSNDGYLYALKGTSPLANSPWPKFHHDLRNTGRSDEGGWSRLMMVGAPMLTPDSSGFRIRVINNGTVEDTVNLLEFYDTPESAYMRDFVAGGDHGIGYPVPPGMPGTGLGDTVHFDEPVMIAPYGMQLVELYFGDFYVDEGVPPGTRANVHGKQFVFRFSDGSVMTVNP